MSQSFQFQKIIATLKINIFFKIFATIFLFVTPMNTRKKENWKLKKHKHFILYMYCIYIYFRYQAPRRRQGVHPLH